MKKTALLLIITSLLFSCSSDDPVITEQPGPTQVGKNIYIETPNSNDNSQINFISEEGSEIIKIIAPASVSWNANVHYEGSWCKVSPSQGKGNSEIKVSVTPNLNNKERTTTLTLAFSTKDQETIYKNINIIQTKAETVNLVVEPDEAGSLKTHIRIKGKGKLVEELTVNGVMNYSDFDTIQSMKSLKKLNLKNVSIVEGKRFDGKEWYVSVPNCIDKNAFSYTTLKSIILPEKVRVIKAEAFSNGNKLEEIVLPPNLAQLHDRCFYNCSSLKKIELPKTVVYMGSYLFENCTALETVTLPDLTGSIPTGLFKNCKNLSSIKDLYIAGEFIHIRESAFEGCEKINSIHLKLTGNEHLGTYNGLSKNSFKGCINLKKITLEDEENSKDFSFEYNVFENCPIEEAHFKLSMKPNKASDNLFMDSKYIRLCTLYIKKGTLKAYNSYPSNWLLDSYQVRTIVESY